MLTHQRLREEAEGDKTQICPHVQRCKSIFKAFCPGRDVFHILHGAAEDSLLRRRPDDQTSGRLG